MDTLLKLRTHLIISFVGGVLALAGCSVYKNENRSSVASEISISEISSTASSAYQLKSCTKENSLEAWFKSEFPKDSYELVLSENDIEIWSSIDKNPVRITSLQKNGMTTQSCVYEFPTKASWDAQKDHFIQDLENNILFPDSASTR